MFARLPLAILAAGSLSAAAVFALAPASATVSATEAAVRVPGQAFTHDLGSKHTVGYFLKQNDACALTMMVAERVDPDLVIPTTGARMRVTVSAGAGALLETGEGAGLSVTCAADASTIAIKAVDSGA